MKYLLVLMCGFIFFSCGTGSKSLVAPRNSLALKLNEKATYEDVTVTLKEVAESRCPMNARCIRAGEAVAVLNVVVKGSSERNIQLCIGAECNGRGLSDAYPLSNDNQKYLFKLDSITPDPTQTLKKAETKVYFSITQP